MLRHTLAAARRRVEHIQRTGDRSLALGHETFDEMRGIYDALPLERDARRPDAMPPSPGAEGGQLVGGGGAVELGREAWYLLGWLHWFRSQELPGDLGRRERESAVRLLAARFADDGDGLPEALLPELAAAVEQSAFRRAEQAIASGDPARLADAAALWQRILSVSPSGHADGASSLAILGTLLIADYRRTGGAAVLDTVSVIYRTAVEAMPPGHPDRPGCLSNLAGVLHERYRRNGQRADLDAAATACRSVVGATPTGHPLRPGRLSSLGAVLLARYEHFRTREDLTAAVAALQQAAELTGAGDSGRGTVCDNLGAVLRLRFEVTGALDDLDAAVAAGRSAVEATPVRHPGRAVRLTNLANALLLRFQRTRAAGDLDAAAEAAHSAVRITPAGRPGRPAMLASLATVLHLRFQRNGAAEDLDAAINAGRAAVESLSAGDAGRPAVLANLGLGLKTRFERTRGTEDLDAAVDAIRCALDTSPAHHHERAAWLFSLGAALRERSRHTGSGADLEAALAAGQAAVEATPDSHAVKAAILINLANTLRERSRHTGAEADRTAAVSAYARASEVDWAAPSIRIPAAREAARMLADSDPGRAADLMEAAVRMLPEVAPREPVHGARRNVLGDFTGLAGEAAALALTGTPGSRTKAAARALRLLETGRATLLSQALDTRSDLSELRESHPELAARFVGLRDLLDRPVRPDGPDGTYGGAAVRDRRGLAGEFAATRAEIRALDGFASFGLPPSLGELIAGADAGPVVVYNLSRYRSDALLLSGTGVTAVPLPGLAPDTVADVVNSFYRSLRTAASSRDRTERHEAQATLTRILAWLWDEAAEPVLTELGYDGPPAPGDDWPRTWWAPGGLLGLLPLHAAGHHTDPPDDPRRRTVMDRVVSSRTPTVRALRQARLHTPAHPAPEPARALVVAMPTTPGLHGRGRLDHACAEAAMVQRRLPECLLLLEPDLPEDMPGGAPGELPAGTGMSVPTKANVLEHLPACSIAHFACHGFSDPADPSKSLLLLHDHATDPLTVAGLAPIRLDGPQLAYLSACRTAAIDTGALVDEAVHLVSAFQLAGFPQVIGTLWSIDDETAVSVADAFYERLSGEHRALDTRDAARALHGTIRGVRDRLPRTPSLWAAYLHSGA